MKTLYAVILAIKELLLFVKIAIQEYSLNELNLMGLIKFEQKSYI